LAYGAETAVVPPPDFAFAGHVPALANLDL